VPPATNQYPLLILIEGNEAVELIDDVLSESTRTLSPGLWIYRSANGEEGGWEPTPLPEPPPGDPGEDQGDGWRPDDLYAKAPALELGPARSEDLRVEAKAYEALDQGEAVRVRLSGSPSIRLSHLDALPKMALQADGRLVIQVQRDG
jgi:hypothetical protein